MNKAYDRTYWENYPSDVSPINETNLNKMEVGLDEIDNRVISLDTTKFDKTEAAGLIKSFELDRATGIITITKYNGSVTMIDTLLEKIAVNFDFDSATQKLIVILDDGTIKEIDLSAFITQYEFLDSDTVAFHVDGKGKVSAIVKEGSIEEKHLRPNYLADVKTEVAKAESSAKSASDSADNAAYDAKVSQSYAVGGSGIRDGEDADNAKYYKEQSAASANTARAKASEASTYAATATNKASAAATSAENAKTSETNAKTSETNAAASTNAAATSAKNAANSATSASASATNAANRATEAESFAHGGTGTRENEEIDNSKYYYEQARRISEGLQGALLPIGTITYDQLQNQTKIPGYMYNISDEFTTDNTFKEGAGYTYPAGTNVYYTADGYWDCLAGTMVTGVKGNAETSYRKGNVNITPANIGALSLDGGSMGTNAIINIPTENLNVAIKIYETGDSETRTLIYADGISTTGFMEGDTADSKVTFTSGDSKSPASWTDVTVLASREKHSSLFNKISIMFKNIRYLYKLLGSTDITKLGNGTVTGALAALNSNLTKKTYIFNPYDGMSNCSVIMYIVAKVLFIRAIINVPQNLAEWETLDIGIISDWDIGGINPLCLVFSYGNNAVCLIIKITDAGVVSLDTHKAANVQNVWLGGESTLVL